MYQNIAILGAFLFLYSLASKGLKRTPFHGAILFTAFGLLFGHAGFGLLDPNLDPEGMGSIAELTLALVLFTDASNADLDELRRSFRIPQRLLLIGLPLTIVLGFGVGAFIFHGLTLLEIALVATILAPTDAALGKAVVKDKSVPPNIREGLNVESGLNDGICVPILFIFLTLATDVQHHGGTVLLAAKSIAQEIGFGVAVGAGFTLLGVQLIRHCNSRGWITKTWRQVTVVALAAVCYTVAQSLGGSGFIATFVGGLFFGGLAKRHKHELLLAAEGAGDALALVTWVIFGAAVTGQYAEHLTWEAILYAVLSLTLIRMLPVYLCLSGLGLRPDQKLFIGWFGPRGMASIVFAVVVMQKSLPSENIIVITVATTILLSILAHGASASPLVAALARRDSAKS